MTDDPNPFVVQKSNRTTAITIASISAIFVLFVAALWGAGFLTFSGSDPSSKVVAGALALLGGLVTAMVSIIGLLLKHSIDQRTEMRLQIESNRAAAERKSESERASALQSQAEQRLGLEAAIRAVELLGGTENSSSALQRAGALFALSNLDQHELTLDLTSYLLESGGLGPTMACSLIDRALERGDENVQRHAIDVLYENAERMVTPSITGLPDAIFNWNEGLPDYVREWASPALIKILMARPLLVWQTQFQGEALAIIAALALAWQSESDDRLKGYAGAMLEVVLEGFPHTVDLYHPKGSINLTQIKAKIAGSIPDSAVQKTVEQLNAWRLGADLDQPPT